MLSRSKGAIGLIVHRRTPFPAGEAGAGTYLVTWNGHGDALALWRTEANGTLTLANSYTYSSWGTPTTAVHNSIPDLGFRFLYVGASDVQWDAFSGADLAYMHARHYRPAIGRFLQPDPSAAEANMYGYAGANPVTFSDCLGTDYRQCAAIAVKIFIAHVTLMRRRQDTSPTGDYRGLAPAESRPSRLIKRSSESGSDLPPGSETCGTASVTTTVAGRDCRQAFSTR